MNKGFGTPFRIQNTLTLPPLGVINVEKVLAHFGSTRGTRLKFVFPPAELVCATEQSSGEEPTPASSFKDSGL